MALALTHFDLEAAGVPSSRISMPANKSVSETVDVDAAKGFLNLQELAERPGARPAKKSILTASR